MQPLNCHPLNLIYLFMSPVGRNSENNKPISREVKYILSIESPSVSEMEHLVARTMVTYLFLSFPLQAIAILPSYLRT